MEHDDDWDMEDELYQVLLQPEEAVCANCSLERPSYCCRDCPQVKHYCRKCYGIHQRYPPFKHHRVHEVPEPPATNPNTCQMCYECPRAHFCNTCNLTFCSGCIHLHNRLKENDHHYVAFLGGPNDGTAPIASMPNVVKAAAAEIAAVVEAEYIAAGRGVPFVRPSVLAGFHFVLTPINFAMPWTTVQEVFNLDDNTANTINTVLSKYFLCSKSLSKMSVEVSNFFDEADALSFQELFFHSLAHFLANSTSSHPELSDLLAKLTALESKYVGEMDAKNIKPLSEKLCRKQVCRGIKSLLTAMSTSDQPQHAIVFDIDRVQSFFQAAGHVQSTDHTGVSIKQSKLFTVKMRGADYDKMVELVDGTTPAESMAAHSRKLEKKRERPPPPSAQDSFHTLNDADTYQEAFLVAIGMRHGVIYQHHNMVTYNNMLRYRRYLDSLPKSNQSGLTNMLRSLVEAIQNSSEIQMRLAMNTLLLNTPCKLFCEFTFVSHLGNDRYEPCTAKGMQVCEDFFYVFTRHSHSNKEPPRFAIQTMPSECQFHVATAEHEKLGGEVRFFVNYRRLLERPGARGPLVFVLRTFPDPADNGNELRFVYYLHDNDWAFVPYRSLINVSSAPQPNDREDRDFFEVDRVMLREREIEG